MEANRHHQEAKLTNTRAERDLQDSLAEIFSIIVTLDELEKAFLKDAIPEAEYTEICERSLRQYKALLADETIAREFEGLEEFKAKWDVSPIFTLSNKTPLTPTIAGSTSSYRATACRPPLHHSHSRFSSTSSNTICRGDIQHERRSYSRGDTRIHHLS